MQIDRKYQDINPEDIFLDSTNLPGFEEHALQGRLEQPVSHRMFYMVKILVGTLMLFLIFKLGFLAIFKGPVYAEISENNRLEQTLIFANRGAILDRKGVELATNAVKAEGREFAARHYASFDGLAHVVGYLKYPKTDKAGVYYQTDYQAKDGIELSYDERLRGQNGLKLRETDVNGNVTSESVVDPPQDGETLTLSLDAALTQELFRGIKSLAQTSRFVGGAGVIMDVNTGEILALTSYPEYNQNDLTEGIDQETFNKLINSSGSPFLDRVVGGLYTPGSIIKPILALGALNEKIITPNKEILSTGAITVPNPYDPTKPSIFKDWKAHGWTDMAEAIAVSSDTYFYSIGGGYADQKGLGISLIDKYLKMFGLTEPTQINLAGELSGVVPTPEWKKEKFDGDIWRLGDTYITSIGQYGTQVTPINAVRFIAAVANEGKLVTPILIQGENINQITETLQFDDEYWRVVQEGMRESVTYGTSVGLNVSYVDIAAKTGTAEVGGSKSYVHSWSVGYFPYQQPRYAWAIVMEKGPANNTVGATSIMRQVFDWMSQNTPEYLN